MREPRGDHGHGQFALNHLVQGRDDRLQLRLAQELDLIEKEDHAPLAFRRGFPDCEEDVCQIKGKVGVVGETLGCFHVQY